VAATDIDRLLDLRTVAVVGLSPDPARDSHRVARYLQAHDYRVIPVNPNVTSVLGEASYPDLGSVPSTVELVDVFRRSEHLAAIVDAAVKAGAKGIWTQLGVVDHAAAERARAAGLVVVEDRCIMVEHGRRR
jgi:predicted CoA-binding protein